MVKGQNLSAPESIKDGFEKYLSSLETYSAKKRGGKGSLETH